MGVGGFDGPEPVPSSQSFVAAPLKVAEAKRHTHRWTLDKNGQKDARKRYPSAIFCMNSFGNCQLGANKFEKAIKPGELGGKLLGQSSNLVGLLLHQP